MFRINDNQIDERCLEDVFTPVPLSEEICGILGFTENTWTTEWNLKINDFSICVDFTPLNVIVIVELDPENYVNINCSPYVHSIQNLYYNLSGEILNTDKLLYGTRTVQDAEESPSDSV